MIRQPISRPWRIGLGISSVLLLMLLYTLLSHSRQRTVRSEQREVAGKKLAQLSEQQRSLERLRAEAEEIEDQEQRTRTLQRVSDDLEQLEKDRAQWQQIEKSPDAVDLTVPTWSMLLKQGLIRASTPQGSFERKEIWILKDFIATVLRLATALLIGVAFSVLLGLMMGCFDPVESFFLPPFAFFSKIPATVVLPIFFVLFQINFKMYLAIIAFGIVPTLAQSISQSVRKDVPDELIFKAFTLGAHQVELIWEVIFKQVLPRLIDAARLQIGPALVLLVAAEWMVAGEGIGYRLRLFYQRTDMTVVFVYVIVLGLLGLAADYTLIWARRRLCPWFGD